MRKHGWHTKLSGVYRGQEKEPQVAMRVSSLLSFGVLLKRQRRTTGLTQEQLSERSGFSVTYISMLERGRRTPNASTAEILVAALEPDEAERTALFNALQRAVAKHVEAALAREWAGEQRTGEPELPVGGFLGARPDGPLVARTGELRVALAALDAALVGTGRLVLLAGEPGIGKTRLAQEVALRARECGALVAVGRCYEPQATTAFYPLSEALATLRASAPAEIGEQITQRWPDVRALLPDAPPSIAPAPGRDDRQRLFWQVSDFVRTVAESQPVALLLDDLQWADEASLDCLRHLARHTRTARVLLLGTYRDVEVHHQPTLRATLLDLVRERLVERVSLRRLADEETAALIAATLTAQAPGVVTQELAGAIGHVTEGHPFFIQEILRALVERGDVVCEAGQWRQRVAHGAAGDLPGAVAVPESVRDTIDARVARLSPLARVVLQEASVLGQTFAFDALRRMGERAAGEVESVLEEALAAALILEVAGEGTDQAYGFNHALTQRAISAGIPAPRRRRLHRAAGAALEALREPERRRRAAEIAWHFQQGDDIERALTYSLVAGEEAERVYASAEAARHYHLASELARELGDVGCETDALAREGRMLARFAPADEARSTLERAADLYRAQGDLNGLARTIAVQIRFTQGDLRVAFAQVIALLHELAADPAAAPGRRTSTIAAGHPDSAASYLDRSDALKRLVARAAKRLAPGAAAQLEIALASLLNGLLRHEEMVAIAGRAAVHARAAADPSLLALAQQFRALGLAMLGRVREAIPIHEAVIQMAERAGDLYTLLLNLTNLVGLLINLGDFTRAAPVCARALKLAERLRNPLTLAEARTNHTELAFFRGDWSEARVAAERLSAFVQAAQIPSMYPFWQPLLALVSGHLEEERAETAARLEPLVASDDIQIQDYTCWALAEYHLVEGRPQRAQALLEPLVAQYHQDQVLASRNRSLLAWAYLDLGEQRRADAMIAQTLAQTARQQTRLFRVDALRVQALCALRAGRLDDTRDALDEALALCRAMPCPYAEAKMWWVYGQLHEARGEAARARACYQDALAILDRLGERLYAERIERTLGNTYGQT